MVIYKIQNLIDGRIYIGQTRNIESRIQQHILAQYNEDKLEVPLYQDIHKYTWGAFDYEIIEYCNTQEELDVREKYWIDHYNSLIDSGGYNLKYGDINGSHTFYSKSKISINQIGKLNHRYGKYNEVGSKRVLNITNNIIYESASECARVENISISKLCAVCRGERCTTNNKRYAYIDNNGQILTVCSSKKKTKSVMNIDTGDVYESAAIAERELSGKKTGNISRSCNTGIKACGYHWKYLE